MGGRGIGSLLYIHVHVKVRTTSYTCFLVLLHGWLYYTPSYIDNRVCTSVLYDMYIQADGNGVGIESIRPIVMAESEESCLCTCPDLPEFKKISKDSKYLAASQGELVTAS